MYSVSKTYFQLFELQQDYDLDLKKLESSYLKLQQTYHPDRAKNLSPEEQNHFLENAMLVNKVYKLLKDEVTRAEYILLLNDIVVNRDGENTIDPPLELLEEIMALREEIEESADALNYLAKLRAEKQKIIDILCEYFNNRRFEEAAFLTIKLKYLDKIIADIKIGQSNS